MQSATVNPRSHINQSALWSAPTDTRKWTCKRTWYQNSRVWTRVLQACR